MPARTNGSPHSRDREGLDDLSTVTGKSCSPDAMVPGLEKTGTFEHGKMHGASLGGH